MIKLIVYQLKRRIPIISILLIVSCLISTVPQFFLPDLYSDITSQSASINSFYIFTLSAFTHSPSFLITHFVGNLLVFLCFGTLSEIIIGSKRFAFITILTFFTTTFVDYLHATGRYIGHGASGIAWGYHTFFILILITLYEQKKKAIFKDIYVLLLILLMVFDIFGIPIFEVVIMKKGFFDNFGQVLHLVSMLVVVPFAFAWRKEIENNVVKLITRKDISYPKFFKSFSMIIIILLLTLNTYGTYKAIYLTLNNGEMMTYEAIPTNGAEITSIPEKIVIKFDNDIKNVHRSLHSMYYNDNTDAVQISEELVDSKTLEISFSRKFEKNESLELKYNITGELEDDILFTKELFLKY